MSLGAPEIALIVFLAILLFGAKKLPELGSSVGRSIKNFRSGMSEAEREAADKAEAEKAEKAPAADEA